MLQKWWTDTVSQRIRARLVATNKNVSPLRARRRLVLRMRNERNGPSWDPRLSRLYEDCLSFRCRRKVPSDFKDHGPVFGEAAGYGQTVANILEKSGYRLSLEFKVFL
jgi:hypothetical protein